MLDQVLAGLTLGWPGAVWSLPNDFTDFETDLEWSDERPKPTLQEVLTAYESANQPSLIDQLNSFFTANLPDETQADLGTLKAAVKAEMQEGRPHIAKLIIQRASIPAELESLRTQLLAMFPEGG